MASPQPARRDEDRIIEIRTLNPGERVHRPETDADLPWRFRRVSDDWHGVIVTEDGLGRRIRSTVYGPAGVEE